MTPSGVFAEPQEVAVDVGHLTRDADLVGMEIGEVLPFVFALSVAAGDFAALFFDQLSGGIVAVGGDFAVLAGFLD